MNRNILYILIIVSSFASNVFSQATIVNVSGASGTLTITNNVQTTVDPSVTINADGTITGFIVSITGSFATGDVLSYTGALPSGITAAAFDEPTKSLVFSGTTTVANWQALLRTVNIRTVSATCFQEQRQVSFVAGNKYYNSMNGHFYEKFSGTISWANALTNAATKSYFGRQGYLVTMTSLAETNFIWKLIGTDSWMGASDDFNYINAATGTATFASQAAAEGRWYWVSGPEKGTLFSVGNSSPVTQPGQFAYWNSGEPNNSGSEHYGQFYAANGGRWNDLRSTHTQETYIVEYGGMSTDNIVGNVVFTRNLLLTGAPSGTITGGNTTVCPTVNSTALTLTGLVSGGTVTKWQYSYDDFLTAGTDIANTTTTYTATNITQNTFYRAEVNTPGCTGLTTSSTSIYVNAAVAGNIVADNNTICVNANVNFVLNGYSGTVTKWQVSTSSTFASGITDIANTTAAMSHQLTVANTYYFRAVIGSCTNTVYTAAYTVSCISGTAPTGGTISNASFCNGSNSGTLTLSGSTGTVTKWQYSTDGGVVWTDISNTTVSNGYSGITTTRKFRALLTSGSCGTVWSAEGVVSVYDQVPSISYSVSGTQYYVLNSSITKLLITNAGAVAAVGSYSVVPALPTGLILGSDGSISGTPTVTSAITTYTITGSNACGNSLAVVVLGTGPVLTRNGQKTTVYATNINKNGAVGKTDGLTVNGLLVSNPINGDGLIAARAASSAKQIKQNYPSSPNGVYWITNPNINGGTAFQVYADMTTDGGGWMLLNASLTGANATQVSSLISPDTRGYLPRANVMELAKLCTDVQLRSGNSSNSYANKATSTNPLAIGALSNSSVVAQGDATWHNGASATFVVNSGSWSFQTCCTSPLTGWPGMYHSNNYVGSVHWFADLHAGRNSNGTDAWYSTWIR